MNWHNFFGTQNNSRHQSKRQKARALTSMATRRSFFEPLEARRMLTANLMVIEAGIDGVLGDIDAVVTGADVLGKNIPFFGSNLQSSNAADFVSDLRGAIDEEPVQVRL